MLWGFRCSVCIKNSSHGSDNTPMDDYVFMRYVHLQEISSSILDTICLVIRIIEMNLEDIFARLFVSLQKILSLVVKNIEVNFIFFTRLFVSF